MKLIQTGGKQYCVSIGEIIKIEKIPFDIGTICNLSVVNGLNNIEIVKAKVISHGLHRKLKIFKMKRRKHYHNYKGHRQHYTKIKIL